MSNDSTQDRTDAAQGNWPGIIAMLERWEARSADRHAEAKALLEQAREAAARDSQ